MNRFWDAGSVGQDPPPAFSPIRVSRVPGNWAFPRRGLFTEDVLDTRCARRVCVVWLLRKPSRKLSGFQNMEAPSPDLTKTDRTSHPGLSHRSTCCSFYFLFPFLEACWIYLCLQCRRPRFRTLGQEDPLEKGMATHFSFLAWRFPWTRGAWRATVHGVAKSQTQLRTTHRQFQDSLVLRTQSLFLALLHTLGLWVSDASRDRSVLAWSKAFVHVCVMLIKWKMIIIAAEEANPKLRQPGVGSAGRRPGLNLLFLCSFYNLPAAPA